MSDDDTHTEGTSRGQFLKRAGAAGAAAAVGIPMWAKPVGAYPRQTQKPIKIGFWAPFTGGLSIGGLEAKKGFELYLAKIRGRIMNRPIQVIFEDDQGNPARSLQVVRKLTEQDRVSLVVGGLNAASGPPVFDYCNEVAMPWINGAIVTDDLTQRLAHRNRFHIRVGKSGSQGSHYLAEWVRKNRPGIRNVAVVGADFLLGYETCGGFQDVFQRKGGAVVQKIWVPLGTADQAPFVGRIDRDVDAIFLAMDSLNSIRFLTTYAQFGLKSRIPVFTGYVTGDETVLGAPGLPAAAVLGNISESTYVGILQNTPNYDFQRRYNARYRGVSVGGSTSVDNWTALQFIEAAIKRRGGDVSNRRRLADAFIGLKLSTPRGLIEIGKDRNAITNTYIRRVDRRSGKLPPGYSLPYKNTILAVYRRSSQYWKFEKEGYLQRPPYTRDHPPIKPKK